MSYNEYDNKTDNNIFIVSGLPRSGTSMMMQMLEAGGLPIVMDNVRQADTDNPKGYYELEKVKKIQEDALWLNACQGKVIKMVSALLPYLPSENKYKVIFMQRDLYEIIDSQKVMLHRLGREGASLTDEDMKRKFEFHLKQISDWLKSKNNISVFYVKFSEVIDTPDIVANTIMRFLNVEMDVLKMAGVVEKRLYRQKKITKN